MEDNVPAQAAEPAAATESAAAPDAPAESWSPDAIEWDSWDGDLDPFPEDVRPLAERFVGWGKSRIEKARSEAAELQDLYTRLLDGAGDPRVPTLQEERDKYMKEYKSFAEKYQQLEKNYQTTTSQLEAQREAFIQYQADQYKQANAWIFDGGEKEKLAEELNSEGWDLDTLPEVMKLPKNVLAKARSEMKAHPGSSPKLVLKAVLSSLRSPKSESDDMVSGTSGPQVVSQTTSRTNLSDKTLADARLAAAEKNLRVLRSRS